MCEVIAELRCRGITTHPHHHQASCYKSFKSDEVFTHHYWLSDVILLKGCYFPRRYMYKVTFFFPVFLLRVVI